MMDELTPCRCDICKVRSFQRNAYFAGKSLSANDLAEEQKYLNEKRRLINRAVIGWGIVCGLSVSLEQNTLVVEPGLALDCYGHEILLRGQRQVRGEERSPRLGLVGAVPRIPRVPNRSGHAARIVRAR
jgi:hypothetical protein